MPRPPALHRPRLRPVVAASGSTSGDGGIPLTPIIGIALIAGGAYLLFRRRRAAAAGGASGGGAGRAGGATPPPDPAALARQANALLIATDERIRDAGQETDYAEAEYGADAVVSFRAAVAEAKDELAKAFAIRQKLDDDIPEDEPTKIAMLQEIIDRTTKAQGRLDAETDRIRELHDLEREAPARLAELPARIDSHRAPARWRNEDHGRPAGVRRVGMGSRSGKRRGGTQGSRGSANGHHRRRMRQPRRTTSRKSPSPPGPHSRA